MNKTSRFGTQIHTRIRTLQTTPLDCLRLCNSACRGSSKGRHPTAASASDCSGPIVASWARLKRAGRTTNDAFLTRTAKNTCTTSRAVIIVWPTLCRRLVVSWLLREAIVIRIDDGPKTHLFPFDHTPCLVLITIICSHVIAISFAIMVAFGNWRTSAS